MLEMITTHRYYVCLCKLVDSFLLYIQDYTITVFLRQYWKDERLAFSNAKKSLSLDGRLAEKLWVPDTFIPNAKESFMHKVTVDNRLIRLDPDGGILYGMRLVIPLN